MLEQTEMQTHERLPYDLAEVAFYALLSLAGNKQTSPLESINICTPDSIGMPIHEVPFHGHEATELRGEALPSL